MAKIENKTREQVISLMAKHIKESCKTMPNTNKELRTKLNNWCSGFGRDSKWSYSEIRFGGDSYIFKDREVTDLDFIRMWQKALELSKVRGKVFYEEYGDGFWCPKTYRFSRIEVFGKVCKEFNTLAKMIQKYTGKELDYLDVFSVSVCGKRSAWSDTGHYYYLCSLPKSCETLINYIRKNKSTKDTLTIDVKEYFSHGDEMDYKCAMYQETEWYGSRGATMTLTITTPSGKKKAEYEFLVK